MSFFAGKQNRSYSLKDILFPFIDYTCANLSGEESDRGDVLS